MQKQSLILTCACGRSMEFPEGEIRFKCKCHAIWEIDDRGFWFSLSLKLKASTIRSRAEQYRNYPKTKRKRRKAGTRC